MGIWSASRQSGEKGGEALEREKSPGIWLVMSTLGARTNRPPQKKTPISPTIFFILTRRK